MRTARTGLAVLAVIAATACSDGTQTSVENPELTEVPTVAELDNAYLIEAPPTPDLGPQRSFLGGGSPHTMSGRDDLEGSGKLLAKEDFERFGPVRYMKETTPFVTGGVSYESRGNMIIGPKGTYGLPSNFMCNNYWTPVKGSVLHAEEPVGLLGFDVSVIGRVDPVDIEIFTTGGTYRFEGTRPPGAPDSHFFGFAAPAGEKVTGFRLTTQGGGSGACMDHVAIGSNGITVTLHASDVVNLQAGGVYPVAVLSDDDFDATTLDGSSATFGPEGAAETHGQGHPEDVDEDGDLDMVLHFDIQDSGIACGQSEATLQAKTDDGLTAHGTASFETNGCRHDGTAATNGAGNDSGPGSGKKGKSARGGG